MNLDRSLRGLTQIQVDPIKICAYAHTMKRSEKTMIVETLSALAESTRLEAVYLLHDGKENCVCELMKRLGATQS